MTAEKFKLEEQQEHAGQGVPVLRRIGSFVTGLTGSFKPVALESSNDPEWLSRYPDAHIPLMSIPTHDTIDTNF